MEGNIRTDEGRDRYLMAAVAMEAAARGIALAPHEVYDFVKTPVLGGELSVENIAPTDFVVALNIAGQIHGQVRNLPPGTKIGEVEIGREPRRRLFGRRGAR